MGRGDQPPQVSALGDIDGHDLRASSFGADALGQRPQAVGASGADHHRRAATGQFERGGLADTATRAGDGHDLAVDSGHLCAPL